MPSKTIVICNRKGGTGKTNVAVNLAAYLSNFGKKILLIDLDPQANATSGLGVDNRNHQGIYEAMSQPEKANLSVMAVRHNLWLMPASENLAAADIEMVDLPQREFILKNTIDSVLSQSGEIFDYIFVDTPPSLSLITINSLAAADQILIPVQAEYYALEGLGQLLKTIDLVKESIKPNLEIMGAVITMYDKRGRLSGEVWEELYRHFPYYIFRAIIPRNVRLAEAPSYGQTIFEYAPSSKGAKAYKNLAREFLVNNSL